MERAGSSWNPEARSSTSSTVRRPMVRSVGLFGRSFNPWLDVRSNDRWALRCQRDLLASHHAPPDRRAVESEQRAEPQAVLQDVDVSGAPVALGRGLPRHGGADQGGESRPIALL